MDENTITAIIGSVVFLVVLFFILRTLWRKDIAKAVETIGFETTKGSEEPLSEEDPKVDRMKDILQAQKEEEEKEEVKTRKEIVKVIEQPKESTENIEKTDFSVDGYCKNCNNEVELLFEQGQEIDLTNIKCPKCGLEKLTLK